MIKFILSHQSNLLQHFYFFFTHFFKFKQFHFTNIFFFMTSCSLNARIGFLYDQIIPLLNFIAK